MIQFEVSGDFACFTMPEAKAERMSYPIITPSSARNLIASIIWKPAIRWIITKIYLLSPIKYITIKRNEIDCKAGKKPINILDHRAQRVSTILKDVHYAIEAKAELTKKGIEQNQDVKKYIGMFNKRLDKGQHAITPYLGCREFTAYVSPVSDPLKPFPISIDMGNIFYDRYYENDIKSSDPKFKKSRNFFFKGNMENGVLIVPDRADIMGEFA